MTIKTYESLAAFFAQENFSEVEGDYVQTLGFDTPGDGGAAMFKVVSVADESANSQLEINGRTFVCKGLTLELVPENNTVYVEQFGAKGDVDISKDLTEEEQALQKATLAAANKNAISQAIQAAVSVGFMTKQYLVDSGIAVNSPRTFLGNNATLVMHSDEGSATMFTVSCSTDSALNDIKFSDFFLFASEEAESYAGKTLVSVAEVHSLTFDNVAFACAEYAANIIGSSERVTAENITFNNCLAEEVYNGLYFENAKNIKIRNFRVNHAGTEYFPDASSGIGLKLNGNCFGANVEDLSVFNAPGGAVAIENGVWDNDATNSIFFKNLLVDEVKGYAITTKENDIPVRFANAMIVNARCGLLSFREKNLSFVNSSIQVVDDESGLIATPLTFASNTNAKFTKVQFEFPGRFMNTDASTVALEANELTFVDCTLQKTDMYVEPVDGVGGVNPTGFGAFGYNGPRDNPFIITFDACEFRSYQRDFCTLDENGAMIAYNPPITLRARTNTSSKLIIKNCRFVNDKPCNAPYFMLDDTKIYGNVVVYNCFFENYTYSETADGAETFPLFAKVTNGIAVADTTNHNVFARCNMRSSTPVRGAGTTINETKEYQ